MTQEQVPSFAPTIAAWILAGVGLILILLLHLLPAFLAGMLVYELVSLMKPAIDKRFTDRRKTLIAVGLLSGFIVSVIMAAIIGLIVFFKSDAGSVAALLERMAEIVQNSRAMIPDWLSGQIPAQPEDLKQVVTQWLRDHSDAMSLAGGEAVRILLYILVGTVLGAMIALHQARPVEPQRALASALTERVARLGLAFRRVVFAQVRIALLNTLFTGIYLALVLPLFGVDLPLKKTMIAITFLAGFLPVLGNLISNAVIVVVSLSYSLPSALAALAFLIVIHKLEYFLNARIVGERIESRAWELLIAMLVMEAAFGIDGLIAAPIYYAYVKDELIDQGLI